MGGCLTIIKSLIGGGSEGSVTNARGSSTELVGTSSPSRKIPASFAIDAAHSSSTIEVTKGATGDGEGYDNNSGDQIIRGKGLALSSVSIEQDSAYWEMRIGTTQTDGQDDEHDENAFEILKFGVAKRCSTSELNSVQDIPEDDDSNRFFLRGIPNLVDGDIVGVAVQQSDLPMVQFIINGEPLHHMAINRFRGSIYPAVWLPLPDAFQVEFIWDEGQWKYEPPSAKFKAIMLARSIV
eukprot:CAMPEP_0196823438 /NCGR_PEP_ID=MMETSP1362-20130617/87445_1 /TAXON_ID=163516 /ORGANISM="Leptocylindrus danicus, Strain CCMP1856" /LENGTH=237 /DNA_ID=CAMNT_0042203307 /DNA_START=71 /DNA_END=784 /DNA_ORIENTATION=+